MALSSIVIGGMLYICFRSEDIKIFSWLRFLNINYSALRQMDLGNNLISSYIIFSFPNGLWVLSGLLFLGTFLKNEKTFLLLYSGVFILIALIIELGQLFDTISGTFDILDLVTIIVFSCFGLYINIHGGKHEKV